MMQPEELSVTLPLPLVQFIESYRANHQYLTRSQVVQEAIELLRLRELENAYKQASQEVDLAWDSTLEDGLIDETW